MDYELTTIKTMTSACRLVHNFIRDYDASDLGGDFTRSRRPSRRQRPVTVDSQTIPFDFESGTHWRSWMAGTMWTEYEEFRSTNDRSSLSSGDEVASSEYSSCSESESDSENDSGSDSESEYEHYSA